MNNRRTVILRKIGNAKTWDGQDMWGLWVSKGGDLWNWGSRAAMVEFLNDSAAATF